MKSNEISSYDALLAPVLDAYEKADNVKRHEIVQHFISMFGLSNKTRKEWFVDYGTMNNWGTMTDLKYSIASELHALDVKERPDAHHRLPQCHNWRAGMRITVHVDFARLWIQVIELVTPWKQSSEWAQRST